jgi:hypothetical protein
MKAIRHQPMNRSVWSPMTNWEMMLKVRCRNPAWRYVAVIRRHHSPSCIRGVTFANRRNKTSLTVRQWKWRLIGFLEDEIVKKKIETSQIDQCRLIEIDPPTGSNTLVVDQLNHEDDNLQQWNGNNEIRTIRFQVKEYLNFSCFVLVLCFVVGMEKRHNWIWVRSES